MVEGMVFGCGIFKYELFYWFVVDLVVEYIVFVMIFVIDEEIDIGVVELGMFDMSLLMNGIYEICFVVYIVNNVNMLLDFDLVEVFVIG